MSGDRPAPWWFSGDDDLAGPTPSTGEVPDPPGEAESSGGGSLDWSALLAGAQRMMDWATDRVMAPHAEHEDPAAHPDCVVCRTLALVGEPGPPAPEPSTAPHAVAPITWLPVLNDPSAPGTGD